MSFLRQGIEKRKTTSSLDDITSQANDTIVNDLPQISAETDQPNVSNPVNNLNVPDPQNVPEPTEMVSVRPPTVTSRKRKNEQIAETEMKLLQDISKRFAQKPATEMSTNLKRLEEDEDRLFLMSLLKELKKVPEDNKLELKSEMMLLIKKWQRIGGQQSYYSNSSPNNQYDFRTTVQENSHKYGEHHKFTSFQNLPRNSGRPLLQQPDENMSTVCSPSVIDAGNESSSTVYSDLTHVNVGL